MESYVMEEKKHGASRVAREHKGPRGPTKAASVTKPSPTKGDYEGRVLERAAAVTTNGLFPNRSPLWVGAK